MRDASLVLIGTLMLSAHAALANAQTPAPDQPAPAASTASNTDSWRDVTFGATLEAYYQFNGNHPPDRISLLRAYDTRSNTFAIQQATLVTELAPTVDKGRRFGLRADLMFGQATETVQGGPANEPRPDVYRHIWQAYGSYVFPVGKGLRTDFGKFASNLGYETNYAKDNDHFSRAYLFNFLPFYHSGLRASLPVGDKVTLMYMLTNGIQQTEDFNNFKSSHVAAVIAPVSNVSWTTSYYFGQEQADGGKPDGPDGFFRVFDTYFSWTPTSRVLLGADINHVTNEVTASSDEIALSGVGVYARVKPSDPSTIALRYERLDDQGLFGGIDQVLQEVTLTAEWKFADGFLIRGEFRRDWSNEPFFTGRRGADDLRRNQPTGLMGLVWWFGNKTGTW
jgi:Putative beta-barrel porin-2, OmpL-like. bbp2